MYPDALYAIAVEGQQVEAGTIWMISEIAPQPARHDGHYRGFADPELELNGYTTHEVEFFARSPEAPLLVFRDGRYWFNPQAQGHLADPTGRDAIYVGAWTFGWLKFAPHAHVDPLLSRVGVLCKWAASFDDLSDPSIHPHDRIWEH